MAPRRTPGERTLKQGSASACLVQAAVEQPESLPASEQEAGVKIDLLSEEAADFLKMVTALRGALGDARGKIRVADVQALAGLDRSSYYRMSLIARAMRHLGWKRSRYRFNGALAYAYARGTRLQREVILEIERTKEGRVVLRCDQNECPESPDGAGAFLKSDEIP